MRYWYYYIVRIMIKTWWRLKGWSYAKYANPNPHCHYGMDPTAVGYCWSYAHHVDGNPAYKNMKWICYKCSMYAKNRSMAEKQECEEANLLSRLK